MPCAEPSYAVEDELNGLVHATTFNRELNAVARSLRRLAVELEARPS